jgi:hypothetical protein
MTNSSVATRTCISHFTFSWTIVVSRPAEGFVAGRDSQTPEGRAIPPSPRPCNYIVSQRSGLYAVVMYRAGCAIAINSKR